MWFYCELDSIDSDSELDFESDMRFYGLSEDGKTAIYRADKLKCYEPSYYLEQLGLINTSDVTEEDILEHKGKLIGKIIDTDPILHIKEKIEDGSLRWGIPLDNVTYDLDTMEALIPVRELCSAILGSLYGQ